MIIGTGKRRRHLRKQVRFGKKATYKEECVQHLMLEKTMKNFKK